MSNTVNLQHKHVVMGLFTAPFGRVMSQVATRYITAPEVGMILMIEAVVAPL
jgi:hypothetical protein